MSWYEPNARRLVAAEHVERLRADAAAVWRPKRRERPERAPDVAARARRRAAHA